MWRHLAEAAQYSNSLPVYWGSLYPMPSYMPFVFYLALLCSASGLSSAVAYQLTYVLSIIPIVSFYSMLRTWLNNKTYRKLPAIATWLSLPISFISVYTIALTFENGPINFVTFLYKEHLYLSITYVANELTPVFIIGIPVFLGLLLLVEANLSKYLTALLTIILVTLGYLAHSPEIFYFIPIAIIYSLLRKKPLHTIAISTLIGLGVIALIDLSMPEPSYVLNVNWTGISLSPEFLLAIFLSSALSFVSLIQRSSISKSFTTKLIALREISVKSWKYFRWILLYIYFMSVIVWIYLPYNVLDAYSWRFLGWDFSAFFFYSVRFGAIALFTVLFLFFYFKQVVSDGTLLSVLVIMLCGILAEQLLTLIGFSMAWRLGVLASFSMCIFASIFIADILTRTRIKVFGKRIMSVSIIISLLVPGVIGVAFFYSVPGNYTKMMNQVTDPEIAAFNFLRNNVGLNESVLTITDDSAQKIQTFAGLGPGQVFTFYNFMFASSNDAQMLLYLFGNYGVRYVYLSQNDESSPTYFNSPFFSSVLPLFPVVFESKNQSDETVIYQLPSISYSSPESKTIMISDKIPDAVLPLTDFKLLGSNDTIDSIFGSSLDDGSLQINLQTNSSQSYVYYGLDNLNIDSSSFNSITINFRTDNSSQLFFAIHTKNNPINQYLISGSTASQKTEETFPIQSGDVIDQVFILLRVNDPSSNLTQGSAYINSITLDSKNSALCSLIPNVLLWNYTSMSIDQLNDLAPVIPNQSYTLILKDIPQGYDPSTANKIANIVDDFLSKGARVVIFGGYSDSPGIFSDMMSINFSGVSKTNCVQFSPENQLKISSTNVTGINLFDNLTFPVCQYFENNQLVSYMLLSRNVSEGQMYYLNISPLLNNLNTFDSVGVQMLRTIMNNIEQPLSISLVDTTQTGPFPAYNVIENQTSLKGDVSFDSTYFSFNQPIDLYFSSGELPSSQTLDSLTIIGPAKLELADSAVTIKTMTNSIDLNISVQEYVISPNGSPLTIEYGTAGGLNELTVNQPIVLRTTQNQELVTINPNIQCSGDIHFNSALIVVPAKGTTRGHFLLGGALRQPLSVVGNCSFTMGLSDDEFALIDQFSYNGSVTVDTSKQSSAQSNQTVSLNVPWTAVLLSPFDILLVIILFILIFRKKLKRM
jgi:hypothetical protein